MQGKCIFFLNSENSQVAGLAATCIGHLARIHKQIDKPKVMPVLSTNLKRIDIKGRVEDAINDICNSLDPYLNAK